MNHQLCNSTLVFRLQNECEYEGLSYVSTSSVITLDPLHRLDRRERTIDVRLAGVDAFVPFNDNLFILYQ